MTSTSQIEPAARVPAPKQDHGFTLRPYQERAVEFLGARADAHGGALFIPMGLGKTAIVLHHFKRTGLKRCLYVGPLRVAATVPAAEVHKWAELQGMPVHTVEGDEAQRLETLSKREAVPAVWTLGFHQLHWLIEAINSGKLKIPAFGLIVFDESSKLKNPATRTFKAALALSKYAKQVVAMSGTPVSQGLQGVWAQVAVVDGGQALGRSFGKFLASYFIKDGYRWRAAHGASEEVQEAIAPLAFSLVPSDWIEVPRVVHQHITVPLSREVAELIDRAAGGCAFTWGDAQFEAAENPATSAMRAWQATQGFIKAAEGEFLPVHDAKLDALVDLLDELGNDEQVLIGHHFQFDRTRILRRLQDEGIERVEVLGARTAAELQDQLARWGRREIRVLLLHPASAGHGVDGLQVSCNRLVWFGKQWSVELNEQTTARLARSGQHRTVFVHHIDAEDSLDQAIDEAVVSGARGNDALLAALAYREARAHATPGATEEAVRSDFERRLTALKKQMAAAHPDRSGTQDTAAEFIRLRKQVKQLEKESHA